MGGALSRSLRSARVLFGLVLILGIGFCALFAGAIAPHDPSEQDLLATLLPPEWAPSEARTATVMAVRAP